MEILVLLVLFVAALWAYLLWQGARARRIKDSDWTILTGLPDSDVHRLVLKSLKGLNPLAYVESDGVGGYRREVSRGRLGRSKNSSTVRVRVEPHQSDLVLHGKITSWEGKVYLGAPDMKSVFAARRRVEAVMAAIQAADPGATVVADGSQPTEPQFRQA